MKSFLRELGWCSLTGLKNTFDFNGSATKREFWLFLLFYFIAYSIVWILDDLFIKNTVDLKEFPIGELIPVGYIDPNVGLAVLLFRPIMAIPTISVTVRRLHDIGKSGWWCVLWVLPLPILGWFWLIPWLLKPSRIE